MISRERIGDFVWQICRQLQCLHDVCRAFRQNQRPNACVVGTDGASRICHEVSHDSPHFFHRSCHDEPGADLWDLRLIIPVVRTPVSECLKLVTYIRFTSIVPIALLARPGACRFHRRVTTVFMFAFPVQSGRLFFRG